jgi:hypothetical protein
MSKMLFRALNVSAMIAALVAAIYTVLAFYVPANPSESRNDPRLSRSDSGAREDVQLLPDRRSNGSPPSDQGNLTVAQNCNINAGGNIGNNNVINCPSNSRGSGNLGPISSPGGPGGRWRNGEFIPTCPPSMGYSLEYRKCIPAQSLGGVIPCSADDMPNCGPYVSR